MAYLMKQHNWFKEISARLPENPGKDVWSDGDQILCKNYEAANAIADLLESLYEAQGENVTAITGYYEPEISADTGMPDRYSGWCYVEVE